MIKVIRKFKKLLDGRQKKKIIVLFLIMLVGTALEVMSVSMMVPMMTVIMNEDIMESNTLVSAFCGLFRIDSYREFVIACILALIVLYVLKDSFVIFQNYAQARFIANNRMAMQKKILEVLIRRPYEFFLSVKTGEVTQMVNLDPANAYGLLANLLSTLADLIVSVALGITVMIIEPMMTSFVLVVMLITIVLITLIARPQISKAGKIYRKSNSRINSWIVEIVNGIKEIKITRREDYFVKHFAEIAGKGIKAEKEYKTVSGIPKAMLEMVSISSALVAILIMLLNGKTLAELVPSLSAFAVAAIKLLPSANKITASMNEISYQEPYLDKLVENIENLEFKAQETVKPVEEDGKPVEISLKQEVRMKELSFRYPNTERLILQDADMVIPAGKSVGVVGPSGAGKTTSVDIILGLLKPEAGQVLSDGRDVMDNYKNWLSHIGYIPQTIFMLDASIRENVAFGVPEDKVDDEKVWKAIREAQLEDFVKSLPEGLDTETGERGLRISGGQKQRIGIARALYYDPELLVFDEATSSLDNDTEAAIMESINGLHGRKTMIIIAHRLQTIEGCDIVYRVENGKITRER